MNMEPSEGSGVSFSPPFTLLEIEARYPHIAAWAKGPTVLLSGTVDRIDHIEVSADGMHSWVFFKDDHMSIAYKDWTLR